MIRESRRFAEVEKIVPEVCTRRCYLGTLHEADHSVSLSAIRLDNDQD
jgi:hypothetical protein